MPRVTGPHGVTGVSSSSGLKRVRRPSARLLESDLDLPGVGQLAGIEGDEEDMDDDDVELISSDEGVMDLDGDDEDNEDGEEGDETDGEEEEEEEEEEGGQDDREEAQEVVVDRPTAGAGASAASTSASAVTAPTRARARSSKRTAPMPPSFHGYACHRCGSGVGFNAKICRYCRTAVNKPPAKYKLKEGASEEEDSTSLPRAKEKDKRKALVKAGGGDSKAAGKVDKSAETGADAGRAPRDISHSSSGGGVGPFYVPANAATTASSKSRSRKRAGSSDAIKDTKATETLNGQGTQVVPTSIRPSHARGRDRARAESTHSAEREEEPGGGGSGQGGETLADVDMADLDFSSDAILRGIVRSAGVAHVKMTERDGSTFVSSVSQAKAAAPLHVFAPLSPLDSVSLAVIEKHIWSVQAETFQRRYRPLLIRLMESAKNGGVFNAPVNPIELGIPDYLEVIKHPMDLGTVRQKLEAGLYRKPDELANDVILTFSNATSYNPDSNPVHMSAKRLQEDFVVEFNRLLVKGEVDVKRKDAHACTFCSGHMCLLCQDKCLRFDPPVMSCDCCMERIKRGDTYYRAPSGQRWCARCVSNGGANAEPGAILPPLALLKSAPPSTLELLVRAMGLPDSVHALAADLLAAATTQASRFGASAAHSAVAAMHEQAAVSAAAETERSDRVTGMRLRTRSVQAGPSAAGAAGHGPVDEADSPSSSEWSPPHSPLVHLPGPPHTPERMHPHLSLHAHALFQPGPSGGAVPGVSLANLAGRKDAQAFQPVPGTSAGGAALVQSMALTISTGQRLGEMCISIGVGATTAVGSPSVSSGPSATQLLAAIKAAGVDTAALTIAAQQAVSAALAHTLSPDDALQKATIGTLAAILRGRLEKRSNNDVVAEPWVQCDRCKGWVHMICSMFNARKNACLPFDAEYVCPCCRRVDLQMQAAADEAARSHTYSTRHKAATAAAAAAAVSLSPRPTHGSKMPATASPTGPQSVGAARAAAMVSTRPSTNLIASLPILSSSIAAGVLRDRGAKNGSTGAGAAGTGQESSAAAAISTVSSAQSAQRTPAAQPTSASADVYSADNLGVSNADIGFGMGMGESRAGGGGGALDRAPPGAGAGASSSPSGDASDSESGVHSASQAVLAASADPACAASALPHTPLSLELEGRVRERLTAETGPDVANSIVIRVVSSLKKSIAVPREVREAFKLHPVDPTSLIATLTSSDSLSSAAVESVVRDPHGSGLAGTGKGSSPRYSDTIVTEYANEYTYRQRVILLWQRLDGVDVCLFALYVQEYGPDCPPPNTRKVYIAYLDSVKYLRPLTTRTTCYHELLAAYLSNARHRGYSSAYIWACPPQRGDGYIFHVHPPSQRVPSKERLREWYDDMLRSMSEEGLVEGINSLFDEYFEITQVSPGHPLPAGCTLVREASQSAVTAAVAAGLGGGTFSHQGSGSAAPARAGMPRAGAAAAVSSSRSNPNRFTIGFAPAGLALATGSFHALPLFAGATTTEVSAAASLSAAAHSALAASRAGMRRRYRPVPFTRTKGGKPKPKLPPSPTLHEVVSLRQDSGLPPYFAGDFWATEMERTVRELHKKLVHRALRGSDAAGAGEGKSKASRRDVAGVSEGSGDGDDSSVGLAGSDSTDVYGHADVRAGGGAGVVKDTRVGVSTRGATSLVKGLLSSIFGGGGGGGGGSHEGAQGSANARVQTRVSKRNASAAELEEGEEEGGEEEGEEEFDVVHVQAHLRKKPRVRVASAEDAHTSHAGPHRGTGQAKASTQAGRTEEDAGLLKRVGNYFLGTSTAAVAGRNVGKLAVQAHAGAVSGTAGASSSTASSNAARTAGHSHATVADFIASNPPVVIGNVIRLGDLSLPTYPVTNIGQRLREMQREIFVVHLTPLRKSRVAAAQAAAKAAAAIASRSGDRRCDSTTVSVAVDEEGEEEGMGRGGAVSDEGVEEEEEEEEEEAYDVVEADTEGRGGAPRHPDAAPRLRFADTPRSGSSMRATRSSKHGETASAKEAEAEPLDGCASLSLSGVLTRGAGRRASFFSTSASAATLPTDSMDGETVDGACVADADAYTAAVLATAESDAAEDERITCDFFDTRSGFLRMCQGNNYQFDTLRRAKHSSMMILWHLHNPSIPAYAHTCNVCETDIGASVRWHCVACFDFDVCSNCRDSCQHPHDLVPRRDNSIVVKLANGVIAKGGQIISLPVAEASSASVAQAGSLRGSSASGAAASRMRTRGTEQVRR